MYYLGTLETKPTINGNAKRLLFFDLKKNLVGTRETLRKNSFLKSTHFEGEKVFGEDYKKYMVC